MTLIPHRFLFNVTYPCPYLGTIPLEDGDDLLALGDEHLLPPLTGLDTQPPFADVWLAWNERGLAFQFQVRGKERPPVGNEARVLLSDRVSLWIDTRDARSGHRASRTCHQFHFLPVGGGADKEDPLFVPMAINRAAQDAPLPDEEAVPFRFHRRGCDYRLEVFLPAEVLQGFDPEQHPRLGFHYLIRDQEKGEQTLSVASTDFPVAEDPSLWSTLELEKPGEKEGGD
jgi:hypothetical protein